MQSNEESQSSTLKPKPDCSTCKLFPDGCDRLLPLDHLACYEPKGGLLTDGLVQEYCDRLVAKDSIILNDELKAILEHFYILTVKEKDAECRERIEGIKREMELNDTGADYIDCIDMPSREIHSFPDGFLQALWKKEGVK